MLNQILLIKRLLRESFMNRLDVCSPLTPPELEKLRRSYFRISFNIKSEIKLIGCASLLFLFSCKASSVAVKPPAPKIDSSTVILDSVRVHAFQCQWFSGKAK